MAIVVVDDSITMSIVLKHICAKEGWSTRTFLSALVAVEHLSCNQADLVVVDWSMPDMDGIEFVKRLRNLPSNECTPVVMVTSAHSEDLRLKALQAGVNAYLTKPIVVSEFKAQVRHLLLSNGRYSAAS
jgi:DNA-binding response OmpR family regulator